MWGAIYEFQLPEDYLHLLNCICNYKVRKPFKCYDAGTYVQFPATRLTSDMWSQVINNFYMRPMYKRPYYYINNINHQENDYYTKGTTGATVRPNYGGDYQGGPMLFEDGGQTTIVTTITKTNPDDTSTWKTKVVTTYPNGSINTVERAW